MIVKDDSSRRSPELMPRPRMHTRGATAMLPVLAFSATALAPRPRVFFTEPERRATGAAGDWAPPACNMAEATTIGLFGDGLLAC